MNKTQMLLSKVKADTRKRERGHSKRELCPAARN